MHSRRSVLSGCGAVLGTAALGGCSVRNSGGGGDGGWPGYTDWLYVPDTDDTLFIVDQYAEVAGIDGLPDELVPDEVLGIPTEDVDHSVSFEWETLYEGSFDASQLRNAFESEEEFTVVADGELRGYDVYVVEETGQRIAFRDGRAVVGVHDSLERFLDTGAGEVDRLVDENDDANVLTAELDAGHSVRGDVKLSDDANTFNWLGEKVVAAGSNVEYGSDTAEFQEVVVFETEADVDEEATRSNFEGDDYWDVSSSSDGRVVTVTYTRPTSVQV